MTDINKALSILEETYKNADTELVFGSVYELLVSVILSAQCTDARVNKVTEVLFKDYNTPEAIADMDIALLEDYIRSCGFYKNKAKHIKEASEAIVKQYQGNVPSTREELISLPGVGRKTASVVLSVGFGEPAFAVDTHVFRVSNRLGLANGKTPEDVEEQVTKLIPKEKWGEAHHWLIHHGRRICHSQRPACAECPLTSCCRFYSER